MIQSSQWELSEDIADLFATDVLKVKKPSVMDEEAKHLPKHFNLLRFEDTYFLVMYPSFILGVVEKITPKQLHINLQFVGQSIIQR
ncbi:MAG: hypothetical protein AAF598_05505 [Bacteroidota bacterium]